MNPLRVRIRRILVGISQERLDDLPGLTFQQVQKYEKGVNRVSASRLFEVACTLSVPANFFHEGLEGPQGPLNVGKTENVPVNRIRRMGCYSASNSG